MGLALVGTLALVGAASASTADQLQPASVVYNEDVTVNGEFTTTGVARLKAGVHIGEPSTGGVTYFNGSIQNLTTAVTVADDLRVDGAIYRTEVGGSNPVKISDAVIPTVNNKNDFGSSALKWKDGYFAGALAVGSLGGTGVVSSANITDGAVATADLASNAVTSAKIANGTITGSDISSSADLNIGSVTAESVDTGSMLYSGSSGTVRLEDDLWVTGDLLVSGDITTNGDITLPTYTSDPTCNSSNEGKIIYNSNSNKFKGCDGTSWGNLN